MFIEGVINVSGVVARYKRDVVESNTAFETW